MKINEAIDRIDKLLSRLETELPLISEEIALDAMALITNRIQQKGLEGRAYSTNPLPTYYFEDRALNGGGRTALAKAKKKKQGISYAEWRSANGLQVGHVDLTYTGRMFQNTGIISTVRRGDVFVTIIGGIDKEVKDKLRWNAQRFGDFFMVTDEEKKKLKDILQKRLSTLQKELGL